MVKASFVKSWKRSCQPRKQRKYKHNAPLHLKQKMLHVHLSPELRRKYGKRNLQVKKGDKIKVMRGQFKKKEGKVEKVNLRREQVFVTGIESIKKEGTKISVPLSPSNLMMIELNLEDHKRKKKIETKKTVPERSEKSKIKVQTQIEVQLKEEGKK